MVCREPLISRGTAAMALASSRDRLGWLSFARALSLGVIRDSWIFTDDTCLSQLVIFLADALAVPTLLSGIPVKLTPWRFCLEGPGSSLLHQSWRDGLCPPGWAWDVQKPHEQPGLLVGIHTSPGTHQLHTNSKPGLLSC